MDCIFCKIISGEIKSSLFYQDKDIVAFEDISPAAPIHKLIVPREHIATINDLKPEHIHLLGQMVLVAKQIASDNGLAEPGYRLVFNCNRGGGQAVFHIHLHLLGGRTMHWPPG